jgi:hypothetical protein
VPRQPRRLGGAAQRRAQRRPLHCTHMQLAAIARLLIVVYARINAEYCCFDRLADDI